MRQGNYTLILLFYYLWRVSGITLFDKKESYAIFDVWNITTVGQLELKFKTQSRYCLLLYVDDHHFKQYDEPTETKTDGSFLEVTLIKGQLEVTLQILNKKYKQRIRLGHHLNDLAWHTLRLTKFVGTLQVNIDDETKLITLSKSIADSFYINSRLYIGGLSKTKMERSYGSAKAKPRFMGCIEELKYSSGSLVLSPVDRFLKGEKLAPKCLNTCSINPCQNSGSCINLFNRAGCDCFGTGYDGDRCTTPTDSISMNEKDYIKWSLPDSYTTLNMMSLRLRLKLAQPDGVIFYTKRSGRLLLVEVVKGQLRVAAGPSAKVPRDFILQGNLFDAKWHSITLTQKSNIISVTVDNKNSQNLTVDSEKGDQSGEKDDPVYFGGLELPKFTFEVKSKKNYKGCLQQLQYNKIDVIYKVKNTINKRIEKFGHVKIGCLFNKSNIPLPTTKPVISVTSKQRITEKEKKNHVIKEIYTREGGMDQAVIIWVTATIVVGTIIIMISAACVVHHIRRRHQHSPRRTRSKDSSIDDKEEDEQTELTNKNPVDTASENSLPHTPTMQSEKHDNCKESSETDEQLLATNKKESGV